MTETMNNFKIPIVEEDFSLPKNIRQIGDVQDTPKIYVEDYVITYLQQLSATEETKMVILMGQVVYQEEVSYLFVSGAMQSDLLDGDEEDWIHLNEKRIEFFDSEAIVGWGVLHKEMSLDVTPSILNIHIKHFAGNSKILMIVNEEKEEAFYVYNNGLKRQLGYYVYYEKNNNMQEYMVQTRQEDEVIKEYVPDQAMKTYRAIIQEKKEHSSQKHTTALLYATSVFLVMVVFVIGITMINNYEKMKSFEVSLITIRDTLDTNSKDEVAQKEEKVQEDTTVKVETIAGNVLPEDNNEVVVEQPTAKSEVPVVEQPAIQPEAPIAQPEVPATQPEVPVEQPEAPVAQPEVPVAQPEEPIAQPEVPVVNPSVESVQAQVPESYVIQVGDTMDMISKRFYNTSKMIASICELNKIEDKNKISAGKKILLP